MLFLHGSRRNESEPDLVQIAEAGRHIKGHASLLLRGLIQEPYPQTGSSYVGLKAVTLAGHDGTKEGYSLVVDKAFGFDSNAAFYLDRGTNAIDDALCVDILHGKVATEISPWNLRITEVIWHRGQMPYLHSYGLGNIAVDYALNHSTEGVELYGQEIHSGVRHGEQTIIRGLASPDQIDAFFGGIAKVHSNVDPGSITIG